MKVLLVDDEEKFATMLAKRLALRDIEVDYAFTCADAMAKVRGNTYDVGIVDVKMPGMGGIEIAQNLRALVPGIQIIFLTGHGSKSDYEIATDEATYYLLKPIQIEKLMEILHEVTR
jgi:DNA-binding response OmpR family regulator